MHAKIVSCIYIALLCSRLLFTSASSATKLNTQQTGYYVDSRLHTIVVTNVEDQHKKNGKSGACLQSRKINHIDCKIIDSKMGYTSFVLPHSLLGYQEFDLMHYRYVDPVPSSSPWLSTSNITSYIVPLVQPEINGLMEITVPQFGSVINNELYIEVEYHNLDLMAQPTGPARPENLQFKFEVLGVIKGLYPGELRHLKSSNIEPGSWFYTVTPVIQNYHASAISFDEQTEADFLRGYPTYGYIEFIMLEKEIAVQRRYVDRTAEETRYSVDSVMQQLGSSGAPHGARIQPVDGQSTASADDIVNICIWSSNTMDGQKRIWLQQIEHLDSAKFRFTWMLTLTEGLTIADEDRRIEQLQRQGITPTSMFATVRRLFAERGNGQIIDSPFNGIALDVEDLLAESGDGRRPAAETWGGDELELYRYAHESLILANYSIDQVRPQWCRQFYAILRDSLPPQRCSAIVYGNERGFSADVLVTDAARILGIPTVAELLNLFVHPQVVPTLMIAPSTYAVEHESIQAVLRGDALQQGRSTAVVVVPPSVDTDKFDPALFCATNIERNATATCRQPLMHPKCSKLDPLAIYASPCINIGFVARLAPEKNPGLFLQAAYEIFQLHPFARFTVVGDGALRASLEALAARLQISWAVHFTGWVGAEDLPQLLAGLDIVINTSLRAWSETFCISNIEVMSMEVPLVTFAVGGIGEYVQDPQLSTAHNSSTARAAGSATVPDYSVSSNAVVVNRASPSALAQAVQHLILHPAVRRSIGRAGRQTVLSYFTTKRQMDQYANIYQALHASISSTRS